MCVRWVSSSISLVATRRSALGIPGRPVVDGAVVEHRVLLAGAYPQVRTRLRGAGEDEVSLAVLLVVTPRVGLVDLSLQQLGGTGGTPALLAVRGQPDALRPCDGEDVLVFRHLDGDRLASLLDGAAFGHLDVDGVAAHGRCSGQKRKSVSPARARRRPWRVAYAESLMRLFVEYGASPGSPRTK